MTRGRRLPFQQDKGEIGQMKKVGIVTDSHSGIGKEEAAKLGIRVLAMPFYLDDICYYEDVTISRDEFLEKLKEGAHVSTSQPNPEEVKKIWNEALEEYEQIVYIPLSSVLSGSCERAQLMTMEEPYAGKVFVVDNGRVSTPQHRSILDAQEMIEEGYDGAQIKEMLEAAREKSMIYIGVETLEYLKRGGRISRTTAALGSMLNIRPVLKFSTGILETYKKCRGFHKAKKETIDAMKQELAGNFKEEYEKGEVYLLAASSASQEETDEWVREIQENFPGMDVMCDPLSLGVSCHIGPGGLGIGCSCRPKRI